MNASLWAGIFLAVLSYFWVWWYAQHEKFHQLRKIDPEDYSAQQKVSDEAWKKFQSLQAYWLCFWLIAFVAFKIAK